MIRRLPSARSHLTILIGFPAGFAIVVGGNKCPRAETAADIAEPGFSAALPAS